MTRPPFLAGPRGSIVGTKAMKTTRGLEPIGPILDRVMAELQTRKRDH